MTSPLGHCDVNDTFDDTSDLSEVTLSTHATVDLEGETTLTKSEEVLDIFSAFDKTDSISAGQSVEKNENLYDLLSLGENTASNNGKDFNAFSLLDINLAPHTESGKPAELVDNDSWLISSDTTQSQPVDFLGLFDSPPPNEIHRVEQNDPTSLADTIAPQSEVNNLVDFFGTQNVSETTEKVQVTTQDVTSPDFGWLMMDEQTKDKNIGLMPTPLVGEAGMPDNGLGLNFPVTLALSAAPVDSQVGQSEILEDSLLFEKEFPPGNVAYANRDNSMDVFGFKQHKTETTQTNKLDAEHFSPNQDGNILDFLTQGGNEANALQSSKESKTAGNSVTLPNMADFFGSSQLPAVTGEVGFVDNGVNLQPSGFPPSHDITTLCDVNKPESIIELGSIVTVSTEGHSSGCVDNVESSETSNADLFAVSNQTETNDSSFDGQDKMTEPGIISVNNVSVAEEDVYTVDGVNKSIMIDTMSSKNLSDDLDSQESESVEIGNCVKSICQVDSDENSEDPASKRAHVNPTFDEELVGIQLNTTSSENAPVVTEMGEFIEESNVQASTSVRLQTNSAFNSEEVIVIEQEKDSLRDEVAQVDECFLEKSFINAESSDFDAEDEVKAEFKTGLSTGDDEIAINNHQETTATEDVNLNAETRELGVESNRDTVDDLCKPEQLLESYQTRDNLELEQTTSDANQGATAGNSTDLSEFDKIVTAEECNATAKDSLSDTIDSSPLHNASTSSEENLFNTELCKPIDALGSDQTTPGEQHNIKDTCDEESIEPFSLTVESESALLGSKPDFEIEPQQEKQDIKEFGLQLAANELCLDKSEKEDNMKTATTSTNSMLIPIDVDNSFHPNLLEATSKQSATDKVDSSRIDDKGKSDNTSQQSFLVTTSDEATLTFVESDIPSEQGNVVDQTASNNNQEVISTLNQQDTNQLGLSTVNISDETKSPDLDVDYVVMNPAPPPRGKKKTLSQEGFTDSSVQDDQLPEALGKAEKPVAPNEIDPFQLTQEDELDDLPVSFLSVTSNGSSLKREEENGERQNGLDLFQEQPTNSTCLKDSTGINEVHSEMSDSELGSGRDEIQIGDSMRQQSLELDNNPFGMVQITAISAEENTETRSLMPGCETTAVSNVDESSDKNLMDTNSELHTSQQFALIDVEEPSAFVTATNQSELRPAEEDRVNLSMLPDVPQQAVIQQGSGGNESVEHLETTEGCKAMPKPTIAEPAFPVEEDEKTKSATSEELLHTDFNVGNPAPPPREKRKSAKKEKGEELIITANTPVDKSGGLNSATGLKTESSQHVATTPYDNEVVDEKPEMMENLFLKEPLSPNNVDADLTSEELVESDTTFKLLEFGNADQLTGKESKDVEHENVLLDVESSSGNIVSNKSGNQHQAADVEHLISKETGDVTENVLLDVKPPNDDTILSNHSSQHQVADVDCNDETTATLSSEESQKVVQPLENMLEVTPMAPPRARKKISVNPVTCGDEQHFDEPKENVTLDSEGSEQTNQIKIVNPDGQDVLDDLDTVGDADTPDTLVATINLGKLDEIGSQDHSDDVSCSLVKKSHSESQNLCKDKKSQDEENESFSEQNSLEQETNSHTKLNLDDEKIDVPISKSDKEENSCNLNPEATDFKEQLLLSSDEGSLFGSDQMNVSDLDDSECGEMQVGDNISQISLEFDDNPFASVPIAPSRGKRKVDLSAAFLQHETVNLQSNVVPSTVFMDLDDMDEDNDSAKVENDDTVQLNNEVFVEESLFAGQTNLTVQPSSVGSGTLVSFDSDWEEFQQTSQPINTLPVIEEESEPDESDEDSSSVGRIAESLDEFEDLVDEIEKSPIDKALDDGDLATQYNELWGQRTQVGDLTYNQNVEELPTEVSFAEPELPGTSESEQLQSTNLTTQNFGGFVQEMHDLPGNEQKSNLENDSDDNTTTTEGSWCIIDKTSEYEDWSDNDPETSTSNDQLALSDKTNISSSEQQNIKVTTTGTTEDAGKENLMDKVTTVSSAEMLVQNKDVTLQTENAKDKLETPEPLDLTELNNGECSYHDSKDTTASTATRDEISKDQDFSIVGNSSAIDMIEDSTSGDAALQKGSQDSEFLFSNEVKPTDALSEISFSEASESKNSGLNNDDLLERHTTGGLLMLDETSDLTLGKVPDKHIIDEMTSQSSSSSVVELSSQGDLSAEQASDVTVSPEVDLSQNSVLLLTGKSDVKDEKMIGLVEVSSSDAGNVGTLLDVEWNPDLDTNDQQETDPDFKTQVDVPGLSENMNQANTFSEVVSKDLDIDASGQENVKSDTKTINNDYLQLDKDSLTTHPEETNFTTWPDDPTTIETDIMHDKKAGNEGIELHEVQQTNTNLLEVESTLDQENLFASRKFGAKEENDKHGSEPIIKEHTSEIKQLLFETNQAAEEEINDTEPKLNDTKLVIEDLLEEKSKNIKKVYETASGNDATSDVILKNKGSTTNMEQILDLVEAKQGEQCVTSIVNLKVGDSESEVQSEAKTNDDNSAGLEKENMDAVFDENVLTQQLLEWEPTNDVELVTGLTDKILLSEQEPEFEPEAVPKTLDEMPVSVSDSEGNALVEVTSEDLDHAPNENCTDNNQIIINKTVTSEHPDKDDGSDANFPSEVTRPTESSCKEIPTISVSGAESNALAEITSEDLGGTQNESSTDNNQIFIDNLVNSEQLDEIATDKDDCFNDKLQSKVSKATESVLEPSSIQSLIMGNIGETGVTTETVTMDFQADIMKDSDEDKTTPVVQFVPLSTNSFQGLNINDQIFADPDSVSIKPLKKLHLLQDGAETNTEDFSSGTKRVRYDTIGSIDLLTDSEDEDEENETQEQFNSAKAELVSIDLKNDDEEQNGKNDTVSPTSSLRRRSIVPPSSLVLSIALDDINVQTPTQESLGNDASAPSESDTSNTSSAADGSANDEKSDPEILLPSMPVALKEPPVWETVVIGNVDYRIDGRAIQNYKRVISHGGFYKEKQAIVEIFGQYLPDSSVTNYIWVMDNLFLYLISTLELLVQHQEYVVVFFNGSVSKNHFPSTSWLKKSHLQVPHYLRKNLKGFYVVQSSFYFKTLTSLTRMFLSRKVFKKTKNVKNHKELKQFIPTDFLFIPQDIASNTSNLLNYEQMNKSWQWWWAR